MTVRFTFTLVIPALDRLVDYLQSDSQQQVDNLTAKITQLTSDLQASSTKLQTEVTKET